MDQDILEGLLIEKHFKEEEASIDQHGQLVLQRLGQQLKDKNRSLAMPVAKKAIFFGTVRETSECLCDRTRRGHGRTRSKQWS